LLFAEFKISGDEEVDDARPENEAEQPSNEDQGAPFVDLFVDTPVISASYISSEPLKRVYPFPVFMAVVDVLKVVPVMLPAVIQSKTFPLGRVLVNEALESPTIVALCVCLAIGRSAVTPACAGVPAPVLQGLTKDTECDESKEHPHAQKHNCKDGPTL